MTVTSSLKSSTESTSTPLTSLPYKSSSYHILQSNRYIYLPPFLLHPPLSCQALPPYNGFGSLEDSKQSCLSLVPQPPKKDFIKMLENDGKVLRFAAVMVRDSVCV